MGAILAMGTHVCRPVAMLGGLCHLSRCLRLHPSPARAHTELWHGAAEPGAMGRGHAAGGAPAWGMGARAC